MLYSRKSGHYRDREREKEALKSRIGILQSYPEAMYAASDLPDSMDVPFSVKGQWEIEKGGEADGKMGPDAVDGESAGFSDSSLSIESGKNFSESQQKSGLPRVIFDITKSEESGPGSRGGIVVGYWPSGKPKYLSELKEYNPESGEIQTSTVNIPKNKGENLQRGKCSLLSAFQYQTSASAGMLSLPGRKARREYPESEPPRTSLSYLYLAPWCIRPDSLAQNQTAKAVARFSPSINLQALSRSMEKNGRLFLQSRIRWKAKRRSCTIIRTRLGNRIGPDYSPARRDRPPTIHHSGSPGKSNLGGQGEDNSVPTKSQQKSSLPRVIYEASPTTRERDKPGSQRNGDLPPAPGTIHRSSPGSHLAGIEKITAAFRESKQKTFPPYQIQKAGLVPKMCEYCREWEASQPILRVFASYAEFARSEYYAGGDLMQNDPYAEYAVWPGKTNANRHYSDWWICTPVHPNCNHSYQSWEPPDEDDYDFSEHFADLDRRMAERQQKAEEEYYGKSRIAPIEVRGVWHERTCACEDPVHDDRGSWVREYIARRFPVVVG